MEITIDMIINGELEESEFEFLYAGDIAKYLLEKYELHHHEMDTNGWDYDFWIYYIINEQSYMISGSGYYGNLKFMKCEE